jgi:hypothetical protein
MSTPSSKAAEIAARQVEQIVEAAQLAADRMQIDSERELQDRRREVEKEGDRIRTEAKRESDKLVEDARVEALKITEEARKKAEDRTAAAEKAADEALADAQAMSAGLRRLAAALERQAEQILREVQAGHRAIQADLRVASGPGSANTRSSSSAEEAPARSGRRRGTPFEDIEVPNWVGPE